MDTANSIITAAITSGIIAIIGGIYKLCHHCNFRSSCCGREVKIRSDLSPPKESFDMNKKKEVISV